MTTIQDLDFSKSYTYADYLKWTFEETVELIQGKPSRMATPSTPHQDVLRSLFSKADRFLEKNSCKLFCAPFDVRLIKPLAKRKSDSDIVTVVQPDLCIVCDLAKLDKRGCLGVPDLVMEILSKSTATKDQREKFEVYEESGVREYWIIDIEHKSILLNYLEENGKYRTQRPLTIGDTVTSHIFSDFLFPVEDIFRGILEFVD